MSGFDRGQREAMSEDQVSDPWTPTVRRFVRRATGLLVLRGFVRWSTVWLLAWGLGAVVLRVVLAEGWGLGLYAAVGGAGLIAILLAAAVHAHRRRPDAAAVRALLDHHNRCGGLLMTEQERSVDAWRARVPALEPITPRWRAGRPMAALTAAAVFVTASWVMPVGSLAARPAEALDVTRPVSELRDRIEAMEQADWLTEEEVPLFHADLDRLEDEARGDEPTRTWEALDHVRQRLDQAAEEATEQSLAEAASTASMRVLAEALAEEGDQLDTELRQRAVEDLAEMVSEALTANQALREQLGERLADAGEAGSLSPEHMRELADRLRQRQEMIEQMMQRMHEAELVDAETLAECLALGECASAGFCQFASDHGGMYSFEQMIEAWMLGSYGISDEGGLSPMTFRDSATDEADTRFEPQMLPSDRRDLADSELVGLGAAAPEVDEQASASVGGALDHAAAAGGQAHEHRVLPRHRHVVQRYFDRQE